MGKVFKARYYPRGNFMEANTGYLPSYAWRSMLSARVVVAKGCRWRYGIEKKSKSSMIVGYRHKLAPKS